jgi:membrane fusion protein (multidrug efflux system)
MLKKVFLAVLATSLLIGVLVYIKLDQFTVMGDAAAKMVMPPQTVSAMQVQDTEWEQVITATGSVSAVQGVTVSAEVGGRITQIAFQSADSVSAGQTLLQMDTASEDSQLASAQAAAALAKAELARLRKLIKKNLAAEDSLDRSEAQVKETTAQVGVIKALIEKKTVKAPFSGRLGIRQVNLGQILSVGDPIVELQMLDPIYVDFSIPQQKLSQLQQDMQVKITSDAVPGKLFTGTISAINLEIDAKTRNILVRAKVENPEEQLRVGMFVNIEVLLPEKRRVLTVPSTAIHYATFGNSVFVIDETNNSESGEPELILRQQFVVLGESRGDFIEVIKGLKPGEKVVTTGVFKLRGGMKVIIDNSLSPEFNIKPSPKDA